MVRTIAVLAFLAAATISMRICDWRWFSFSAWSPMSRSHMRWNSLALVLITVEVIPPWALDSVVHSLIHSIVHPIVHPMIHPVVYSIVHSLFHSVVVHTGVISGIIHPGVVHPLIRQPWSFSLFPLNWPLLVALRSELLLMPARNLAFSVPLSCSAGFSERSSLRRRGVWCTNGFLLLFFLIPRAVLKPGFSW